MKAVEKAYQLARERYAESGVDTEAALAALRAVALSMHCWQGDDVGGFENAGSLTDGGIMATGNHPGRARTPEELRADLEKAYSLIPGRHRLNLHAIYGEFGGKKVDRDAISFDQFRGWAGWAKEQGLGVDFNPTFFAHPRAAGGFTLTSPDEETRRFWVRHGIACREIGAAFGKTLGKTCITNVWIPDGYKDAPADRMSPRRRLQQSLDEIFAGPLNPRHNMDAVESKLFGIGTESYVAGSHEFYLAYAIENRKAICLDSGHFHPTETISDKLSSVLLFLDDVLLHVSRGVRWDSDHVVVLGDDIRAVADEIVRCDCINRVHIGLDYFDASINRVAAWAIGMRAMLRAMLEALLSPAAKLKELEADGDLTGRLALMEEAKNMPVSAVWDYHCLAAGVPVGAAWLAEARKYEKKVLNKRG
ncbi:MAG: L-rhamnose isomerase [Lentisphaerae bacterium]|nr:L-rhamnose isomerase [Lentisphaerota bacterium]